MIVRRSPGGCAGDPIADRVGAGLGAGGSGTAGTGGGGNGLRSPAIERSGTRMSATVSAAPTVPKSGNVGVTGTCLSPDRRASPAARSSPSGETANSPDRLPSGILIATSTGGGAGATPTATRLGSVAASAPGAMAGNAGSVTGRRATGGAGMLGARISTTFRSASPTNGEGGTGTFGSCETGAAGMATAGNVSLGGSGVSATTNGAGRRGTRS